jgi:hypothetical protein
MLRSTLYLGAVRLPESGVYPWVLLTGEGDEVLIGDVLKL